MSAEHAQEIAALLEEAGSSLMAAQELLNSHFWGYAASRAYYAAYYAASALLLQEGMRFRKHRGVLNALQERFVKTGRLSEAQGKTLLRLFELRTIGDYGFTRHVEEEDARQAVIWAEEFIEEIRNLL